MIGKDKFEELHEYCQAVKFGTIYIEITVHQGEAADIKEFKPPLRNLRGKKITKKNSEKNSEKDLTN